MNNNFLHMFDYVSFSLTDKNLVRVQDDYTSANPVMGREGLVIDIAASHAGIITRNNGFYLPDKMKAGAKTFLDNFGKPILVHHKSDIDAIGRVIAAEYVDISHKSLAKYHGMPIKNSAGKETGLTINDSFIEDFSSGKMPYGQLVDVVRNFFTDAILSDKNYEGLGYVKITARITDPEAIKKVLDGRYLTGSVGAKTTKAVCSICKTDWVESGQCDHKPGAVYDKAKCYVIAGDLDYDEYSFVNKPADRHSKVIELNFNGIKNSINAANDFSGIVCDSILEFPEYKSEENTVKNDIQDSVNDEVVNADTTVKDEEVAPESFDAFLDRVLSLTDSIQDADEEKLYELMLEEMKAVGLTDEEINDAKLTTEARKKLAASTFCGPGRSFPVPDCAHVTAARRLIDRYAGGASKQIILDCVARKAKAMGCAAPAVKDATTEETPVAVVPVVDFTKLGNDEVAAMFDVLVKEAKSRSMSVLKDLVKTEELALLDEVARLETLIGELRDQLAAEQDTKKALKDEYDALYKDHEVIFDSLVDSKKAVRTAKEKYASLLLDLKDSAVADRQEAFSVISDEALDLEIEKTSKEIDMKKITDKLGDGLSRIPNGTVKDPAVGAILDQDIEDNKETVVEDQEFAAQYLRINKLQGRNAAEAFRLQYAKQKEGKKLPTGK